MPYAHEKSEYGERTSGPELNLPRDVMLQAVSPTSEKKARPASTLGQQCLSWTLVLVLMGPVLIWGYRWALGLL